MLAAFVAREEEDEPCVSTKCDEVSNSHPGTIASRSRVQIRVIKTQLASSPVRRYPGRCSPRAWGWVREAVVISVTISVVVHAAEHNPGPSCCMQIHCIKFFNT